MELIGVTFRPRRMQLKILELTPASTRFGSISHNLRKKLYLYEKWNFFFCSS